MKALFSMYSTYGKFSGDEITAQAVIEDTPANRNDFLEENVNRWAAFWGNTPESFIAGDVSIITFSTDGGDWDDPTGGYVTVESFEDALAGLNTEYRESVDKLCGLFHGEETA